MVASRSLDYITVGIDEYLGVTIISDKCMIIKDMITDTLGRGVTIYRGKVAMAREVISKIKISYTQLSLDLK